MRTLFTALLAAAVVAPLSAQTPLKTVPKGFLKTEGRSSHHAVWYYTNGRALYSFSEAGTGFKGPTVIRGLRTRGNGTSRTGVAWTGDFEITVSSNGVSKVINRSSWKANYGKDVKLFMKKKKINVKGWTGTASPRAWGIDFKGDSVYVTKAKDFLIDVSAWTPTTVTHNNYQDAEFFSTSGRGRYTTSGRTPCPTNFWNYASGMRVGVNTPGGMYSYGYSRNIGDVHFAMLGFQKISKAFGSFAGAPCTLYLVPAIITPPKITTTTDGYAYFTHASEAVMKNKALAGIKFLVQHAAIDAKTKGFKLGRGIEITIGPGPAPIPAYTVYGYASGSRVFDPAKTPPQFSSNAAVIFGIY